MPPKAPNLKFKPKLVLRQDEASARPSATQPTDDLSLVQLARLQGLYVEETNAPSEAPIAESLNTASPSPASPITGTASTGRGGGSGGGSSTRRAGGSASEITGGEEGQGTTATSLLRPKTGRSQNLSAHAALEEAARRRRDLSEYPDAAPALPINSINAIVSPAMTEHEAPLHTTFFVPLPLDAALPSRLAGEGSSALQDSTTSRVTSGQSGVAAAAAIELDGIAFLREAEAEQARAFAANTRFYEEHLRHAQQTSRLASGNGELVWMQLPRFHDPAPFSLTDLPPGKVGELKVLRSGRMVLELAGVHYEVSVEGYDGASSDGACAMAVATQPSTYPGDPDSKASCYELGLLQKKLVCTPTLP